MMASVMIDDNNQMLINVDPSQLVYGERLHDFLYENSDSYAAGIRHTGEVALWRAVIRQMLTDAFTPWSKTPEKDTTAAKRWFRRNNVNLHMVCDLAEVDVRKLLEVADDHKKGEA